MPSVKDLVTTAVIVLVVLAVVGRVPKLRSIVGI